jgi:tRNA A-37 threonylcarbamoyl transferase component Bud32
VLPSWPQRVASCAVAGAASELGTSLAAGATFAGRYQIVRCLRAGGMGAVYEVTHLETRRKRALKVMLPNLLHDDEMRQRFRAEATVASEVTSDHIVEVFDAGIDVHSGAPFIVMELLQGQELADVLAARGRFTPHEVLVFVRQVAVALDKTHAAGIVHRDLKPENLFLTQADDGAPRLKVLDFGIAKLVESATQTGLKAATRSIGTPIYMAPEQIEGRGVAPATDVYALTQVAFTLLVGEAYFGEEQRADGNLFALLMKVAAGPVEPASARAARRGVTLPAGFDAWFSRGTAVAPRARFGSAGELAAALAGALGLGPVPVAAAVASGRVAPSLSPMAPPPAPAVTHAATPLAAALSPAAAHSASRGRPAWLLPAGIGGLLLACGIAALLYVSLAAKPKRTTATDDEDDARPSSKRDTLDGMSTYIRKSKTAEARNTVRAIGRAVMAAYEREAVASELLEAEAPKVTHALCGSTIAVPAKVPAAMKYQPSNADGQDFNTGDASKGWRCLKFTMTEPMYYQYEVRVGTSYKGPSRGGPDPGKNGFEISAEGDLDGDGKTSLFTLTGTADPQVGVRLASETFIIDELE